jgi:hypothetical protein
MSKTRDQIQFKTLSILNGGLVGDAPSAEDVECIDGYIDSEVARLSADGTIYIDDPDELPDELFTLFCQLVANAAADEYGGTSDEGKRMSISNALRRTVRQTPGYGPQQVEWF